ncbi:hypothetical protein [Agrobacterium sp. NPDC090273]|uniref:hypothetical protein n=1 Tax=Agrobacterium sp. NPDC090273 TaxID=3363919 RepID=UPI00383BE926
MTLMPNRWLGLTAFLFAAEGSGSGSPGGDGASPSPEAVLFPNDRAQTGDEAENGQSLTISYANADDDATDDPASDEAGDLADTVPEDGRYSLTMPEGVEVDQELLDALGTDFRDMGLTSRQAQKLADTFIETQTKRGAAAAEGWANRVQGWADDARKDRDIGGHKWQGTVSNAQRALSTLGTPALKEYLNASGGGNHPELIRIFAKVGSMIREDNPPTGGADGDGRKAETAHLLFPNDAPKGK